MTSFAIENARTDDVARLLRLGEEYALALYPTESTFLLSLDELDEPHVTIWVAREAGEAVGMAALIHHADAWAELKRVFVVDEARGRGVATGLLACLEADAAARGVHVVRLETGIRQPAAMRTYERHGYTRIANFGPYTDDPLSVCYEKRLTAPAPPVG